MKNILTVLLFTFVTFSAAAYITVSFPGWDMLTEKSSDIIVVRCVNTSDPFNTWKGGHQIDFRGLIDSDYQIVSVLKGRTNSGIVRISSEYWPRQGNYYLLFQDYIDGSYGGVEDYRFVPLGAPFLTNSIAGKSLDERLQILFKRSDFYLNRETQKNQEQKNRLEQALQK